MSKELLIGRGKPWLKDRTILLVESGSKAYGTSLPTSDSDYKGVCIPPEEYYFGFKRFEHYQTDGSKHVPNTSEDVDITIYSLKKFAWLARQGNPNILEMLFMDESNMVECSPEARELLKHKQLFLTNKIANSFGGFATQHKTRLEKGLSQRQGLVELYGYDTKTVMHAVRVYEMGIEAFTSGTFSTKRSNAEELKDIRKGKYTLAEALELLNTKNEEFGKAKLSSVLPPESDDAKIEELLVGLTRPYLLK